MITTFDQPILSEENSRQIASLGKHLKQVLPEQGITGPYDVELGFKDNKLWLFQVRPFVENKKAVSSEYLQSITPKINVKQKIDISTPL